MGTEIEHMVYDETGRFLNCFTNSGWYDTATPAQWCIRAMTELKNILSGGKKLKIISCGKTYEIATQDDFRDWLKFEFKGGFEIMIGLV